MLVLTFALIKGKLKLRFMLLIERIYRNLHNIYSALHHFMYITCLYINYSCPLASDSIVLDFFFYIFTLT